MEIENREKQIGLWDTVLSTIYSGSTCTQYILLTLYASCFLTSVTLHRGHYWSLDDSQLLQSSPSQDCFLITTHHLLLANRVFRAAASGAKGGDDFRGPRDFNHSITTDQIKTFIRRYSFLSPPHLSFTPSEMFYFRRTVLPVLNASVSQTPQELVKQHHKRCCVHVSKSVPNRKPKWLYSTALYY